MLDRGPISQQVNNLRETRIALLAKLRNIEINFLDSVIRKLQESNSDQIPTFINYKVYVENNTLTLTEIKKNINNVLQNLEGSTSNEFAIEQLQNYQKFIAVRQEVEQALTNGESLISLKNLGEVKSTVNAIMNGIRIPREKIEKIIQINLSSIGLKRYDDISQSINANNREIESLNERIQHFNNQVSSNFLTQPFSRLASFPTKQAQQAELNRLQSYQNQITERLSQLRSLGEQKSQLSVQADLASSNQANANNSIEEAIKDNINAIQSAARKQACEYFNTQKSQLEDLRNQLTARHKNNIAKLDSATTIDIAELAPEVTALFSEVNAFVHEANRIKNQLNTEELHTSIDSTFKLINDTTDVLLSRVKENINDVFGINYLTSLKLFYSPDTISRPVKVIRPDPNNAIESQIASLELQQETCTRNISDFENEIAVGNIARGLIASNQAGYNRIHNNLKLPFITELKQSLVNNPRPHQEQFNDVLKRHIFLSSVLDGCQKYEAILVKRDDYANQNQLAESDRISTDHVSKVALAHKIKLTGQIKNMVTGEGSSQAKIDTISIKISKDSSQKILTAHRDTAGITFLKVISLGLVALARLTFWKPKSEHLLDTIKKNIKKHSDAENIAPRNTNKSE